MLPPFEWYTDQAQMLANSFMKTPEGQTPRFLRWSDLFDLAPVRERVDIFEFADLLEADDGGGARVRIDRALHNAGAALLSRAGFGARVVGDPLSGPLFA